MPARPTLETQTRLPNTFGIPLVEGDFRFLRDPEKFPYLMGAE